MELIKNFQFGYMAVACSFVFVVLYLAFRYLRRLWSWMNRSEGPRERAGAYVVLLATIGVLVGGLSQGILESGAFCHDAGQPVVSCVVRNTLSD